MSARQHLSRPGPEPAAPRRGPRPPHASGHARPGQTPSATDRGYFTPLSHGPFSPELNHLFSSAFGGSLEGLSVVRGADAPLAGIGAAAATVGSTILLGSNVREQADDPHSMGILAHELSHALAPTTAPQTLLDRAGDPGESQADRAGQRARDHVARGAALPSLPRATGGRAAVHRFNIYFQMGPELALAVRALIVRLLPAQFVDVVMGILLTKARLQSAHETLSALALQRHLRARARTPTTDLWGGISEHQITPGRGHSDPASMGPAPVQDLVRGVRAPDDPRGDLHGTNTDASTTQNPWYVLRWGLSFGRDEVEKTLGRHLAGALFRAVDLPARKSDDITWQSHNGALQSLHGMQPAGVRLRETVKARMMRWALFLVDVAQRRRGGSDRVPPLKGLAPDTDSLFRGHQATLGPDALRRRAVGALFHLIQDSYAGGHTRRGGPDGSGDIEAFHDYAVQSADEKAHKDHERYDRLADGETLDDRVSATRGASMAVDRCATLLELLDREASRGEIEDFLSNRVFRLAP